jgi:hypothetical protein
MTLTGKPAPGIAGRRFVRVILVQA